jgi:putative DNA methylase
LARHDIPMAWDFAESVTWGESSGSFSTIVSGTSKSIQSANVDGGRPATVQQADACSHPLSAESTAVWFTDPPYYDAIPYAHLSDFFHIWQIRSLTSNVSPGLTPKKEECVVDRPHRLIPEAKTRDHFEKRVGMAMAEGVRIVHKEGVACVVFAHKTTEGWEALLGSMITGGWVITASWPITTEMQSRLNARDNASLASSVHLVCRPRLDDAPTGDWGQLLRELPKRVADWMSRLQGEGVRGADLVFACIGPALEVYSRYSKVVDAEEREIPLGGNPEAREAHQRGFLAYVWEVVGRAALE